MEKVNYNPQPIDTSDIQLPEELNPLLEAMAKNVHENWEQVFINQEWTYGALCDNLRKRHYSLKPCEQFLGQESNAVSYIDDYKVYEYGVVETAM